MKNNDKTKEPLLKELALLKAKIAKLEKNKDLFQIITEKTSENIAITTFDLKAKYLYVSPSIKHALGYDPEDMLGKSFFDFIHPDDKRVLLPLVKKYISLIIGKVLKIDDQKITETIEFRFKDKAGNWRYIQSTVNFIEKNLLAFTRDITEHKQAEETLKQSEKNYRDLFNNATDAIYIQDREGRFLDVNQGAVDMYGYPKDFFTGKTPEFLSAPEKNDMKKIIGFVEDAFNGKPRQYDFWGIRKNREVFPKIVRSQQGIYLGQKIIITFAIDITERKRAQEELEITHERLELAMDAGEHGFWDWNLDTNDVYFSPRWYTMLGYNPGELPMRLETWVDLMHPDDRKTIVPEVKIYVKNAQPYEVEFRLRTKDNDWKWISGRGKSYEKDKDGISHRAVGVHVDITERKQAEEELVKHREHLEELVRERTAELEEKNEKLAQFNKLFVDREFRIKELKDKVKELVKKLSNS